MSRRRVRSGGASRKGGDAAKREDAAIWKVFSERIQPLDLKQRVPDTHSALLDEMLRQAAGSDAPAERTPNDNAVKRDQKRKPNSAGTHVKSDAEPMLPSPATRNKPQVSQSSHIDDREVRRLGKGRGGIDARIDLHGMRQSEAHAALRVFLFRSVAKGHRMVLVITGKGGGSRADSQFGEFVHQGALGRGVLRQNVPLWLAEPDLRPIVVGHTTAHVRHGGDGALYVQLRRRRAGQDD